MEGAPGRADPSQWSGLTNVVSDSKLRSIKQRESVSHHFQSPAVRSLRKEQVQVPQHDIRRHPRPCLSANTSCCTLNRIPTPSKNTCTRTCSAVVAKWIDLAATPAHTRRERKRETQAAQEENPEQLRVELQQGTGWNTRQRCSCHRTTL